MNNKLVSQEILKEGVLGDVNVRKRPVKIQVLIALSDFYQAYEMAKLLTRWYDDIMICESLDDAMKAMETDQFHLFVVDDRLPDSLIGKTHLYKGLDFIRFIRLQRSPVCRSVIVHCRSSHTSGLLEAFAETRKALDAGANRSVASPVTLDKIEQTILPELRQTRPFIRHYNYIGPCRRRKHILGHDEKFLLERRSVQEQAVRPDQNRLAAT